MRLALITFTGCSALLLAAFAATPRPGNAKGAHAGAPSGITQGALLMRTADGAPAGECPLKHTSVDADISGMMARVNVTQEFVNNAADTIEAVYVFPLPHDAAVDSMTIRIGNRTIKGQIKKREEAKAIYDAARAAGRTAALLDQERANIFTQSVANIPPGAKVEVIISYVERLPYEAGTFSFVFPMVVGPRYIPGTPVGKTGGGWADDTDRVPDASRITPPVAAPGTRAGHDISINVKLDAGLPLDSVCSPTHDVDVRRTGNASATAALRAEATIPNKDFVLKYDASGRVIQDAVLTHADGRGGYVTLILQPPERVSPAEVTPKELVFVLDTSGSMMGFPIEKAKEAMRYALDGLNPADTFNLITFSGDTEILFPQPVPATKENLARAQRFLVSRSGSGGTEMMKAIRAALESSDNQKHVRVVCFMTDGYVGNENEIIAEVRSHPNARIFSFGIGNSVNRFLLDKMAQEGRGEVEYVGLNDDGSAAAKRFHERVRNPLLTDIRVSWNNLPVSDVYPKRIPDLFSAKPLVISGRYNGSANGVVRIEGTLGGKPFARNVSVNLPSAEKQHEVLAKLWARTRIDHLLTSSAGGERDAVTQLGLDYSLMTPYTSFVAVDEKVVNEGGKLRTIQVPVEMPEGVSHQGVFGSERMMVKAAMGQPLRMNESFVAQDAAAPPPAPVAIPTVDLKSKLHPALKHARGVVEVDVWVSIRTEATLQALRNAGLVFDKLPVRARLVRGRIAVEKLETLIRIGAVTYVAPASNSQEKTDK